MTIKTLTGHYTGGYTLSPAYTGVHVSYNASVAGYHPVLSGDGGAGLTLTFAASLYNAGVIVGGAGSAALSFGRHNLGAGQGGAGASVAAGGAVSNVLGYFYGGAGGAGNARFGGAAGGAGILAGSGVSVFNFHSGVSRRAVIAGGAGGDALALYAYDGGAGGDGVDLAGGSIINQAAGIVGGRGGAGGTGLHKGGDGGDGVVLSASGSITNAGFIISAGAVIKGGGGGDAGGQGGRGGTGVVFQAGGTVTNAQEIDGGNGGHGSIGGAGATGLILGADGVVNNDLGHIRGGQGGSATVTCGDGGAGVVLIAGGTVNNSGYILGGYGGVGFPNPGASGTGGDGIVLLAGGTVINTGTVQGGSAFYYKQPTAMEGKGISLAAGGVIVNGGTSNATALIYGVTGVYAGPGGGATVTNFGVIGGQDFNGVAGLAIDFRSASDRLIAEAGSTFLKQVHGGGGTLELATGAGTVTGLGATATVSGAEAMTFSGFGAYAFDTGTTWTLAGTNSIGAGQSLSLAAGATILDNSSLVSTGTVVLAGSIGGSGILTVSGGSVDLAAGAAITVGQWALTGGLATVEQSLTFSGGFSQGAAATMTIALSDTLTLAGTSSLAGIVNGAGSLAASAAAVNGLTVGGTATLIDTGTVTQTGGVTIGDASSAIATLSIGAGATWTINGAVGIARGAASGSRLQVAGTLIKSGASGVSVVGLAAFDTGLIEVAGGTLDFQQAITGTGALRIDAGAILEVDSSLAKNVSLAFNGAATLALKNPTKFAATIGGFAIGDTIDLLKIAATGASINAKDQLVIVNGATTVATLKLSGVYSKAKFAISSDGHGGTRVTLLTLASSPPSASTPHAFAAAMAGLGGGDSGSAGISPTPAANLNAIRLLAPGVH